MDLIERFLSYVAIDTCSREDSPSCPSTEHQFELGKKLAKELAEMGAKNARVDEHCYVYAEIPANTEGQPVIGLIAHMDVVDCVPSANIRPRRFRYEGGDIVLNEDKKIVMRLADNPRLDGQVGHELIVTDGTTLLGADDKAGVAEIMALAEYLLTHPEFPHGTVKIGFTPDEEIGRGADLFDVEGFNADFAYTMDGDFAGGIEFENFNAAAAQVILHGHSVHPGSAKGRMVNAIKLGMKFNSLLPAHAVPEATEGYEGFFHLNSFTGEEEKAELRYIIRDHDADKFEIKKEQMKNAAAAMNLLYGEGTVELTIREQYRNMKEIIDQHPEVVARAQDAICKAGLSPVSVPVRGGTDGARLCYMGLPCPNLGTGGSNYHGTHEYADADEMRMCVEILKEIVRAR